MAERKRNEVTVEGTLIWMSDILERGNSEIIKIRLLNQTGKYENIVEVEFYNDRIDDVLLFEDEIGKAELRVRASVNGRIWEPPDGGDERYFQSLMGWSLKFASTPESSERRRRRKKEEGSEESPEDSKEETKEEMPGENEEEIGEPEPKSKPKSKRRTKKDDLKKGGETVDEEDMPF